MNRYAVDIIALKKIMVEKNLDKISTLSRKANINRNILGNILNGKSMPTANTMYKLVETLEISPEKAGAIFLAKTYVIRKFLGKAQNNTRR